MTGLKTQNRRSAPGDPLSDLLDDTDMKRSGARARPRVNYPAQTRPVNVWWFAAAASIIWIAAVLAFSYARFALPGDPRSVLDAAQARIGLGDWLMILASIVGPVLLIWVIAWLVRRSMELRDESRRLAKAAILLADAAETAEKRAERMLPAPGAAGAELLTDGPGHLHREIERASHAMNALQTQMSSMEEALARQAKAFDTAAEQTATRTRALEAGAAGLAGAALVGATSAPSVSDDAVEIAPDLSIAPAAKAPDEAVAVDLAFAPQSGSDVGRLTDDLKAAAAGHPWTKLVSEAPAKTPDEAAPMASQMRKPLEDIREDVQAIKAPVIAANDGGRIDPFDDLGPSTPKATAGAALGGAATLGFGATRDEPETALAGARLDAPVVMEPVPAPPSADLPKAEEFEFMARALDWKKFVRAANFPENEGDTETLDALYDVLTDPEAAALLQSSEDVLATLADLDLYMEDFVPEMSPILTWRAHLQGDAKIGGIDAPIEQSRVMAKLSSDGAFKTLCERFIDRYQVVLKRLFSEAEDRLALELADSRTGRAYILVAGCMDRL